MSAVKLQCLICNEPKQDDFVWGGLSTCKSRDGSLTINIMSCENKRNDKGELVEFTTRYVCWTCLRSLIADAKI